MRGSIRIIVLLTIPLSFGFTPNAVHRSRKDVAFGKRNAGRPLCLLHHRRMSTSLRAKTSKKGKGVRKPVEDSLSTYDDYRDQLEALSYLSVISSSEASDLCRRAQEVFDSMYEEWAIREKDDLEPTTEIYNLMLSIYASSGDITTASMILSKMENGKQDGMPSVDMQSYLAVMEGFSNCGKFIEAEETFKAGSIRFVSDVTLYNSMLSIWKRSGDRNSPAKAENLLEQMIQSQGQAPLPNTESFALGMECFCRNSNKSKLHLVLEKIQELVQKMKSLQDSAGTSINVHDRDIVNAQIKALGYSKGHDQIGDAEKLLYDMIKRYDLRKDERECPSAATFINVINICGNDNSVQSAQKASELLKVLENMYKMKMESGMDYLDLKPSVRVYNAVMNVWSRSDAPNKAEQTKALLDRLELLWNNSSDKDYSPNQRTFNTVINACAFSSVGSIEEQNDVLRIMIQTFNMMQSATYTGPNHVTYGLFLKGCYNLVSDQDKREVIVENVFRKCCKEGLISKFVLDTLFELSSPLFLQKIFGDNIQNNVQIPAEWCKNV